MGKSYNYKQELDRLIAESSRLEEKAKLDFDTADFMNKQSKALEKIVDNPNTSEADRESAMKKMETLYARLQRELIEGDKNANSLEINITKLIDLLKKEANHEL